MPLVTSKEMFEKAYNGGYAIGAFNVNNMGKRGFEGQKFTHTASSPSTIRQVWSRGFPWLNEFLLRQNCKAPASDGFSSVF